MNNDFTTHYRRLVNVINFFAAFAAVFKGASKAIPKAVTAFLAKFNALEALLPDDVKQTNSSVAVTASKDQLFINMQNQAVGLSKLALVWAKSHANSKLIQSFSITLSDFKNAEIEQVSLAKSLLQLFHDNQKELIAETDITDDNIKSFENSITLAHDAIGQPAAVISNNKATNQQIEAAFKDIEQDLTNITDLIKGLFGKGMPNYNAKMLSQLTTALKLPKIVRYTAVTFNVINAITKDPIDGVKIDIPSLNKSTTTDINGNAPIESIKPSKAQATATHPLYKPESLTIKPQKGKSIIINISLTPL